jgi:hypothetical protein
VGAKPAPLETGLKSPTTPSDAYHISQREYLRGEIRIVDEKHLRESVERDQLWASLRALAPELDRLAAGEWQGSERERQLVQVLAAIVAAELRFRAKEGP